MANAVFRKNCYFCTRQKDKPLRDTIMRKTINILRSRRFAVVLLVAAVFAACTTPSQHRRMETMLADYEQRNSNYDTLSIDSTQRLADFFLHHGTNHQRMRAFYLLGCAHETAGESPQALDCFNKVLDKTENTDNEFFPLLIKAHCQKAYLFLLQYLPRQALRELDLASKYASADKDTLSLLRIESNKADCYYELGKTDSMNITSEGVFESFCEYGDSTQAAYAISSAIYVNIEKGEWEKAKSRLGYFERHKDKGNPEKNALFDYYKSRLLLHENKADSAVISITRMLELNHSLNSRILAYHTLLQIYRHKEIADSVFKYSELYCNANDSSMKDMATTQLGRMEAMYNYGNAQHLAAVQTLKAKRLQGIVLVLILAVFIVMGVFYIIYSRIRKMRRDEHIQFNSKYRDLLIQYNNTSNDLQQLAHQLDKNNEYVKQKEKELEDVKLLLERFYEDGYDVTDWQQEIDLYQTEIVCRMHHLASTGKQGSDCDWAQLRKTVNKHLPKFIPMLSSYCDSLNLRETNLCILVKLHFIPTEIAVLLNMNKQSVGNLRVRLLRKIFKIEGSTRQFDDKIHEIVPR